MKQKLVLIGNGMAGMRTVDELLKLSSDKFDITVFGAQRFRAFKVNQVNQVNQ